MCGIVGQISRNKQVDIENFNVMRDTLIHRGPDDFGTYKNQVGNIALGHRRLSFLDLSPLGRQPMLNQNNQIALTFNGEIYNYLELKEQLADGFAFKTDTDTEVIIAAYLKWGTESFKKLEGMFAFGILDEKKHKLYLCRDSFGIKPLYYHKNNNSLLFSSELKAICSSKEFYKELNLSSVSDYFTYRFVPSPKAIWKNTFKVKPAHFLEIDCNSLEIKEEEYWKLEVNNNKLNRAEAIEQINAILKKSVDIHSRADVEIGSFLSGGYDSSAICHYLKKNKLQPKTFSIGFNKWKNSEHNYAKMVADHLELSNYHTIADNSSLELIDKMPIVYDEPIADISIIPTYLVSQLAKNQVKAVMSGEGADEIFVGYHWQKEYIQQKQQNWLLTILKRQKKPSVLDFYSKSMAMGAFDLSENKKLFTHDLHKEVNKDPYWFYRQYITDKFQGLKQIQYLDIKSFMGELVLTKIDRASMANSLEVRVPFLNRELFTKIFSLSESVYYNSSQTKDLLYENIKNHLPQKILARNKQGFVGPDKYYMNVDWYKEILLNGRLIKDKIINKNYVEYLLTLDYDWRLWKIAVFEKWYAHWN